MPRGVAHEFLDILGNDRKVAVRRITLLAVVAVLLAGPAWYLAEWIGVAVHVGAVVVGLLAGFLAGQVRYEGRFTVALMDHWREWMAQAPGSESVAEVARRTTRRSGRNRPLWYALVFTVLWALEVLLLVIAFQEDPASLAYAAPVLALNGLAAGGVLGYHARGLRWCITLRDSLDEMVRDGEMGVWGVR